MRIAHRFKWVSIGAAVAVCAQFALAKQATSAREKDAENAIANFVEQARKQNRVPRLRRIHDRHLRADACSRAKTGNESLNQSSGIGPPEKVGMISAFWYSTLDPHQPPPELLEWAKGAKGSDTQYEQPHRFSVGVCLIDAADRTGERYWIDVGMYMGAVKSFFYIPMWD